MSNACSTTFALNIVFPDEGEKTESLVLQLFDALFSIECDFDKNPHQMLEGWSNMEISYLTSDLEGFSSSETSKLHRLKFCELQLFCAQKRIKSNESSLQLVYNYDKP